MDNKISKILKQTREKRKLTIQTVAQDLNIKSKYLIMIEENDEQIAKLINSVSLVAYLKSYSHYLKLDNQLMINKSVNSLLDSKKIITAYNINNDIKDLTIAILAIILLIIIITIWQPLVAFETI